MKAAAVLDQRALPGNGHREEEGVEAGVIEPLADVAAGREYEPFGSVRNRGEPVAAELRRSLAVIPPWSTTR